MRSGFVAVAGRPNVGKSTLVNALCGDKVAITSNVPNTTRRRIFGVANGPDWQLVLADLPGFQRPMDALTERMQSTVDAAFQDIDIVLLVVSARDRIGAGDRFIGRRVFGLGIPVIIAVNKIDRLKHGHVATQMKAAATLGDFHALHPVSAVTKDGIGALRDDLVHLLPEGPLYFPIDQSTDETTENRVAEVIREKALHLTRDEVPHAVTVVVEEIGDKVVRAFLLVETESQKGILVGRRARWCARSVPGPGRRSSAGRSPRLPRARRQGALQVAARPEDDRASRYVIRGARVAYPAAGSNCQRWNALPSLSEQAANQPCVGTGSLSSAVPSSSRTFAIEASMSSVAR